MTVDELLEFFEGGTSGLTKLYVQGYEGGLEDLERASIQLCRIKRDPQPGSGRSGIYGPHEEVYIVGDEFDEYGWVLKRGEA